MSLFDQLRAEYSAQRERRGGDERDATTTIGGTTVSIGDSQTVQSVDDTFLVGSETNGVPRGREAFAAREIAETQPMQVIGNTIVDQLLGGELAYPSDDGDEDQAEAELKAVIDDILQGPHLQGEDFDDLVAAIVHDLIGPGDACLEPIAPEGDVDLPFVALKPVDPLSVRYNVDEHGTPQDPPYYQAPFQSLGGSLIQMSGSDITPLDEDDLVVMSYPGSKRSNRVYPMSPAMQVREWLEIIADSTTHHSRYYKDNELPPGLLTAREASQQDLDNIRDELEAAKADPRSAPVVGTDARWVEVGGTAVDLDVIEEQRWFMRLCAAAFGIPQTELGIVEDVNRAEGDNQLSVVHKRVTQPLARTIGQAITRQLLPQFDLYTQLDQPFEVKLRYSDPRQERAHEAHLRERWLAGGITYREYREGVGDDMTDADTTVELNGQTIDYGDAPKFVVESVLTDARNDDPPGAETAPGDE